MDEESISNTEDVFDIQGNEEDECEEEEKEEEVIVMSEEWARRFAETAERRKRRKIDREKKEFQDLMEGKVSFPKAEDRKMDFDNSLFLFRKSKNRIREEDEESGALWEASNGGVGSIGRATECGLRHME